MSAPGDRPVDIEFLSVPSLGLKAVTVDADVAEALIAGMRALGIEAEKVETGGNDLYLIWVRSLP